MASLLRLALGHLREAPASEHNVDHDLQVPHPRREGGAVIARALEEEDRSRDDLCGNQFQAPITYWLISTQVPTWKIIVCLIQASFETPHLA